MDKNKNVKKTLKSKPNQSIKQHYGLEDNNSQILTSANFNIYYKTANEVARLLSDGRQQGISNVNTLKKYSSIADQYASELWTNVLEEKYKDDTNEYASFMARYTAPDLPFCKLTKNGKIKEDTASKPLFDSLNEFNVVDTIPFRINSLSSQLMQAPKSIVAETCFNAVGDHNRPCFVIRKILSCEIHDKKYLLLSDEKYYQNSPTVAYPLTLLYGGLAEGAVQIARIDSVAHLDPKTPQVLGLKNVEFNMPDYLLEKFTGNHHNYTPKKGQDSNSVKKISASDHIHLRDSNFELLYALSHMTKTTTFRTDPTKFLTFNAKEISVNDLLDENSNKNESYGHTLSEQLDMYRHSMEKTEEIAVKNNGLVPTELLQKYYARTFNITNYEINPNFCKYMDELRAFKPERLATLVDTDILGKRKYSTYVAPTNSKPAIAAKRFVGKIIDYDYVVNHNRTDIIDYYKSEREKRINESKTEVPTSNDNGPEFTR